MMFSKAFAAASGAALVAAIAGAMELSSQPAAEDAVADAAVAEASVKGRVRFEGERPKLPPLNVTAEQSKGCCPEGQQVDDTNRELLISEDGGIANVVVTIDVDGTEAEALEEPLEVDQTKCHFEPHVVVVPAGSKVAYLNSDEVSHNVHTYAIKNQGINETVSAGGSKEQTLAKAEVVKITCDIHPWMLGYIYVTDAAFYAVTDADGNFEIEGLPPGEHKVEFWHEKLGKAKADVTVNEDGSAEPIELEMSDKKKAGGPRRRR